jgi:mannose-6-phosphate isomerase-like protein (cupin superfamily)
MKNDILIRNVEDVEPVPCPCGQARRIITGKDTPHLSIHRVTIDSEAEVHYHEGLTEYYVILDGAGEIEANGERFSVKPGDVVMIPPETRHALRGTFEIINIVAPPFDPNDEHLAT